MSHHPPTSRPKPTAAGNEEASAILNLGEFENVQPLTLSETALIINALTSKRRNERKNQNDTEYVLSQLSALAQGNLHRPCSPCDSGVEVGVGGKIRKTGG